MIFKGEGGSRKAHIRHNKFPFSAYIFSSLKILIVSCLSVSVRAQNDAAVSVDSISRKNEIESYYKKQRDIADIVLLILHKNLDKRVESNGTRTNNIHLRWDLY